MRKIAISCLLLLTLPFSAGAFAQDELQNKTPETANGAALDRIVPEQPHYYHLDLVVKELGEDGKPVNSRTYSCTVSTARGERDSVRIGSRIPILTASDEKNAQFQYQDVGVSFDVNEVREAEGKVAMNLLAQISSLGASAQIAGVSEPVIRQNRWQAPVLIPIGKPTVVFTSDDTDSKGGMQVVVTATLLE
jgi:hypothetical protein